MGWLDFDEMIIRLRTLWTKTYLENDIADTNDKGNFYDEYYPYSLIVFINYTEAGTHILHYLWISTREKFALFTQFT